ncbi:hypothetical protein [Sphingomonas qomolangmaensis]|uniref:Uncharacterized protein n=1 Tax=Sphingomonas qomolangmaensis TaxID=2918765 RepID=A0ABY5L3L9_9SPHN|nr:hypothetical protein [Sphingomonas qomolangmaensis]UUL81553.1 hypothetical protein NMP03_10065 [Sphingomonas qomolangmaensis]
MAALIVATPCAAQDQNEGERASVLADALAKCPAIAADAERLACFDRTSAALLAAREAGNLVFVDREGMRTAKRAVFGFSLPKIKLFGDGRSDRAEPEVREIDSVLASVRQAGNGIYLLALADESQWQTTEARTGFFPKAGKPVKIEAGLLGSYSASIDGKRAIKVKRIR